ncbi:IclR family transcriptional regulator [Nesterenkonia xinjiangensis]|uniref:DNA-binding IclR family transcriptional regulator n=1 Tax=Nesterenkonia xinjiangensis TaxID=225327 RepID=A0A7Z0K920_9MICC|nr:IclR family transcriptional regulator [Nesterenkonia xinjiangensis]NYJ78231.1 DNA-binding IclR family transcriptional regulator [Nesterenkonia xinjiangensis]
MDTESAATSTNGKAESGAPVRSVDRALTVLTILAREGEASLSQMARELRVHKSTVGRLTEVLVRHDLVEPPEGAGGYRLGVGCLRLAGATTARLDLTVEAQPVCDELSAEIGETTNVAITREGVAINVCQSEADTAVAMRNWIGQHTALHATSNGKVLLAHLPEKSLTAVLDAGLEPFTAHTLTRPAELTEELQRIRSRGWAYAVEEFEEGLNAVAAPVFDHSGAVVAGISVAGPSYRLPTDRLPDVREPVIRAADALSRRLGHVGRAQS